MTLTPRGLDTVEALVAKGVQIPNPWTLDIGDDVDVDRISGDGVVIHPGCRIHGSATVISAGVELGREGPVTIEDCRLGPKVALKGGYASKATFLEGSSLGLGHHVREGTLLEEQASGAHCVGLKQTILFPYVTLGSLINFCDAFMAGGTSRSDHSEIGSSYIHFNFTPAGHKATVSMFGDVPRGVTLREKPIFLGGQGGAVGPMRAGFGTVAGAGSVLRTDVVEDDHLVLDAINRTLKRPYSGETYGTLVPMVRKNVAYLAQLDALESWYTHARAPFFAEQEFGDLVLEGALAVLTAARRERCSRLTKLAGQLPGANDVQRRVSEAMGDVVAGFGRATEPPETLRAALTEQAAAGTAYLDAIHALGDEHVEATRTWLQGTADAAHARAAEILPDLKG